MTSAEEQRNNSLVAEEVPSLAKENGEAPAAGNNEDHSDDKLNETELEIQNNEDDLEALVDEDEDKDSRPRRRSWDRTRGRDKRSPRDKDRERNRERDRGRRRSRSNERRRDQARRDPNKSSKDIEQDKARAKKDNDTKALAEKEKAIKTLLDGNDVVPPGTEEEAIQIIADKSQQPKDDDDADSRKRKRSPLKGRLGPRRTSPRRRSKSPVRFSPRNRRSPSPDRRGGGRRNSPSFEFFTRKRSNDRDPSAERREASRRRLRDRRDRSRHRSRSQDRGRRSRSFDRRRSRSFERRRRSRSYERSSPRRRRSVSRSRSPTRPRRRSPFINELARQFSGTDVLRPANDGPLGPAPYLGPMMPGGGGGGPGPGMMPGPMDVMPGGPVMHPGGPPMMHSGGPPFAGYEPVMGFDPLNRGPMPPVPEYATGPLIYNQPGVPPLGGPVPAHPTIPPQPVPAPGAPMYGAPMHQQPMGPGPPLAGPKYSPNLRESLVPRMRTPEPPIISDFKPNEKTSLSSLLEASVSSSAASKALDSSSTVPTFKGFKSEVIRQCERALRSLPVEDPRLTMKGRFFFDPNKKLLAKETKDQPSSNSVLLRKGRTEIHWEEEFNQFADASEGTDKSGARKRVITLQKICQTEEPTRGAIAVQTEPPAKADFSMQVELNDLIPQPPPAPMTQPQLLLDDRRGMNNLGAAVYDDRLGNYDDRRGAFDDRGSNNSAGGSANMRALSDRLDSNSMRDPFYQAAGNSTMRDNEDLRWSLSSNSQSRNIPWNNRSAASGGFSPPRQSMNDHMGHGGGGGSSSMDLRGMDLMRDRPAMDGAGRMMDRGMMDFRDRDMELMEREIREREIREREMREREMEMRERELRARGGGSMGGGGGGGGSGMMDMGSRGAGGGSGGGGGINKFGARREPIEDYDMRNRFADKFNNRGPMDRNEPMARGRDSSPPVVEDNDDLEIIEERVFEREPWSRMGSGAQFNNARGGAGQAAAMRNANPSQTAKRPPFRGGRMGSFRPNF